MSLIVTDRVKTTRAVQTPGLIIRSKHTVLTASSPADSSVSHSLDDQELCGSGVWLGAGCWSDGRGSAGDQTAEQNQVISHSIKACGNLVLGSCSRLVPGRRLLAA